MTDLQFRLPIPNYPHPDGIQSRKRSTPYRTCVSSLPAPALSSSDLSHVIGCILTFLTGWYSDRIGKRYPGLLFGQTMVLIGLILVLAFPIDPRYIGPRYLGCIFVSAGGKLCYPGNLTWVSNNAESNGKRHIAIAVTCTMGSLSTVVGTNVYLGREAPRYTTGLSLSIVSRPAFL
jgi:MFS family permease